MAVSMFIHGGDSTLDKKDEEGISEEEEQGGETDETIHTECTVNNNQYTVQWPPCGRLFRGRLNEAD